MSGGSQQVARAHGTLVALTAGDAGLAVRKREELWGALHTGVDLLFTNRWDKHCACRPDLHTAVHLCQRRCHRCVVQQHM